jgi:hypothetical protein
MGGAMWRSYITKVEREIIVCLAGPLAEARYLLGHSPSGICRGDTQDFEEVKTWMRCLGPDPSEIKEWMLHDRTRKMLRERRTWGALKELADKLIQSGSVSAETAEDLFSQWRVPRITEKAWVCNVRMPASASKYTLGDPPMVRPGCSKRILQRRADLKGD